MSRKPIIRIQNVQKIYDMGEVQVHALRGVDLELYPAELVVLLGPSGSGKSTLLNILGGLDVPTSGSIRYGDRELTAFDDAELTRYRREHVGFPARQLLNRHSGANVTRRERYSSMSVFLRDLQVLDDFIGRQGPLQIPLGATCHHLDHS